MIEKKLSFVLLILTFCLLLLGGIVHGTGSSLACPDWPLCYGSFFPTMKGGIAIEHSHRLLAATVGLLTGIQAILLWKRYPHSPLSRLGVLCFLLVVFQGTLGGLTVLYKLPTLISVAHLGTSMIFFSLVVSLFWRLREQGIGQSETLGSGEKKWIWFVTGIVYLQIILGALVRHTGSGVVCPDIPFCFGRLWPQGSHPMVILHMTHRWMAIFVAVILIWFPINFFKRVKTPTQRLLLVAAPLLVLTQIILGLWSVASFLSVPVVTAHLGVAAMLLGTLVSLLVTV